MLPDEKTKCHRTGFEKRCRDMVVDCNCRAWVRVKGRDAETDAVIDLYDCADHWGPQIAHQNAIETKKHLIMVAESVDKLRNEVQQANADGISHVLVGVNKQLKAMEQTRLGHGPAKLLESKT